MHVHLVLLLKKSHKTQRFAAPQSSKASIFVKQTISLQVIAEIVKPDRIEVEVQ